MIGFAAVFPDKLHAVVVDGQLSEEDDQLLALAKDLLQEPEGAVQLVGGCENGLLPGLDLNLKLAAQEICGGAGIGDRGLGQGRAIVFQSL